MFEVTVWADTCRVVVDPAGEVDMLTAGQLREALAKAVRTAGTGPVVVDLARVSFLDSSGVQALVDGYHSAMVAGGTLTVRGARGTVARVLEIVGVDRMLGLAPATPAGDDTGERLPHEYEWPR